MTPNFAKVEEVKILLMDAFGYHATKAFQMFVDAEHYLIDAAVEGAKIESHSWQAHKLNSVGGALGGLRSATLSSHRRRFFPFASVEQPIHGTTSSSRDASRLSQCLMNVFSALLCL